MHKIKTWFINDFCETYFFRRLVDSSACLKMMDDVSEQEALERDGEK